MLPNAVKASFSLVLTDHVIQLVELNFIILQVLAGPLETD